MKCKFCNNWTCMSRTTDGNRQCIYEEPGEKMQVLQILDNIDWQSFRNQAAKDILCAVLPSIQIIDGDFSKSLSNAISNSIDTADELVKHLKEKEKCI